MSCEFDITDFPFNAEFFERVTDMNLDLDKRVPIEQKVFDVPCDIQQKTGLRQGSFLGAEYTCYFPLELNPESNDSSDRFGPVKVRRGQILRAKGYGYSYEGVVEMIRFSQLGGCSVDFRCENETDI